eukprot:768782-Hanusia_phi.AAC.8
MPPKRSVSRAKKVRNVALKRVKVTSTPALSHLFLFLSPPAPPPRRREMLGVGFMNSRQGGSM